MSTPLTISAEDLERLARLRREFAELAASMADRARTSVTELTTLATMLRQGPLDEDTMALLCETIEGARGDCEDMRNMGCVDEMCELAETLCDALIKAGYGDDWLLG